MKSSIFLSLVLGVMTSWCAEAGKMPKAPKGTFSIVVIPDTQHYRKSGGSIENSSFRAHVKWIADNLEQQRIVFVSHVGDIVDVNNDEQWSVARRCMDRLHGRVPYGISVGNHDMASSGDSRLFQRYFPRLRFSGFSWYGGCFEPPSVRTAVSGNNANSYQKFSAGNMEFLFVHLECNAPDDVLNWANDIITRYPDRRVIITTHMGLGPRTRPKKDRDYFDLPKGRMEWTKCHGKRGNSPQEMWEKCFRKHRNIFMICSGDQSRTQAFHQASRGQQGNIVYELLSDYGKRGLRVMRFVPSHDRIEVQTWDTLKGEFCESTNIVPQRLRHQFSLTYEMIDSGRDN